MGYYVSGKPARCSDSFRYPKEGEEGNPHLLHSVPPSLERGNERCFQFSSFLKHNDDGAWKVFLLKHEWAISKLVRLLWRCPYLLGGGIQQVRGRREREKSPLCFQGETPGTQTNETGCVD